MQNPFDSMADMPETFSGKMSVLRESLSELVELCRRAVDEPDLKSQNSTEYQMLAQMVPDLEMAVPKALEAFEAARESHLEMARAGLQVVEDFPAKMKALEEKVAMELAPFAAENFIPKPPEPAPSFVELLDIKKYLALARWLVRPEPSNEQGSANLPRISGNIWENWKSPIEGVGEAPLEQLEVPDYRFPLPVLARLGLQQEPENQLPSGGNIWENWK